MLLSIRSYTYTRARWVTKVNQASQSKKQSGQFMSHLAFSRRSDSAERKINIGSVEGERYRPYRRFFSPLNFSLASLHTIRMPGIATETL